MTLSIRKIAVVGGFAVGAALALAPLAAADTPVDPSIIDSEITSLNSLFAADTTAAAVPTADIDTVANQFTTIFPADVTAVEKLPLFDDLVYGFNPTSVTSDPGAYDVLNGALTKFDDALNVGIYALENAGSNVPLADFATDGVFGLSNTAATDLAAETASQAITTLLGDSYSDLLGYF
jgi:hypothetical protein